MTARPPGLLVSVRSASEAISAVRGGASVVDVKEPARGPLGMADFAVWREVRNVVPKMIPVSVALGELTDWVDRDMPSTSAFDGIAFRKIGLAGSGDRWVEDWATLRNRLGDGPPWIAVIYTDWIAAKAPDPDAIIAVAKDAKCAGVLIDTWDKFRATRLDCSWLAVVERIKNEVGIVALAGGLDEIAIAELRSLAPDLFAVRGAACDHQDRLNSIVEDRVARLVQTCRRESLHGSFQ